VSFQKFWGTPLTINELEAMIEYNSLSTVLDADYMKLTVDSGHPDASAGCDIAVMHVSIEFQFYKGR